MALTATQQALLKKQQDEKAKLAYQNALGKFTNQGAQSTLGATGATSGATSGVTTGGASGRGTNAKSQNGINIDDPSAGGTLSTISAVDSLEQQAKDRLSQLEANNNALKSAYAAQQQAIADRNKASIDSQYDNSEKNAYINYMLGKKSQKGQLSKLGVTGGGAESVALGGQLGYENTLGNLASQRIGDKTSVDNAYADAIADYNLSQDAQYQQDYLDEQDKWDAKIETQKAAEEAKVEKEQNSWITNIDQYNTAAACKAEIKKIESMTGEEYAANSYKLNYLKSQAAILKKDYYDSKLAVFKETINRYWTVAQCNRAISDIQKLLKGKGLTAAQKELYRTKIAYIKDRKGTIAAG